mgnify:CR=1 FL=1
MTPRWWLAVAVFAQLCAGCSLMRDPFVTIPDRPRDASAELSQQQTAVTTHRYTLAPGQTVVGDVQIIEAREQDTFSDIARSYGLGYDELVFANPGVDPWLPGVGTRIVLPTRFVIPDVEQVGIVLNIAAKRLFWFPPVEDGDARVVETFPIGIGRVGWATPTGSSTVIAKAKDPAWYVPASVRKEHREAGDPLPAVVPPGPDNPLGRHVLKLDMPGYLLHGTNQPYGVGMRVSHGCVRLYPENIAALFDVASIGTPVRIVNEPLVAGWRDRSFYVVAYPRLEDDERSAEVIIRDGLDYVRDRHWMLRQEDGQAWLAARMAAADGVAYRYTEKALSAEAAWVNNVTAPPEDAPSRAEVADMLETLMDEAAEDGAP